MKASRTTYVCTVRLKVSRVIKLQSFVLALHVIPLTIIWVICSHMKRNSVERVQRTHGVSWKLWTLSYFLEIPEKSCLCVSELYMLNFVRGC